MTGRTVAHYQILEKLGQGGMGVVYKAFDTHLDRYAAIKFLPPEKTADAARKARFIREAKAASALNHPNLITVYDIDQADGADFIAMEYVAGQTLDQVIGGKGMPLGEALHCAIQIADALSAAHEAGIVHRDIKPSNVIVTDKHSVKVLDFGLAKLVERQQPEDASTQTMDAATAAGTVLGTAAYMSPEQAEGKPVDARADVFSFGAVLYEMLTGTPAFRRDSIASTLSAVLHDQPDPVRTLRRDVPADLNQILVRSLEKNRDVRYSSAVELHKDLLAIQNRLSARGIDLRTLVRQPRFLIPAAAAVLALAAAGIWYGARSSRARWARNVALPEISRLAGAGQMDGAFRLVRQAERYIPDDATLKSVRQQCSASAAVVTEPAGAAVYWRSYQGRDAEWEPLGKSPVKGPLVPRSYLRWKFVLEGYDTSEAAGFGAAALKVKLTPQGAAPPGMVHVPGGRFSYRLAPSATLENYWLDKCEVTNQQFKEFIDRGGYEKREYWKQPFLESGRQIAWEEAMTRLRDSTGRPGPATWELGTYPEGQADYPVGGVSWYEAAAYAEFAGKSLPTIYHWYQAAGMSYYSDILQSSNLARQGPALVGSFEGLSPYGNYDMAGNVKEWCWNKSAESHYILGGGWNDAVYAFSDADAQPPFARLPSNGFRCAKYSAPLPETLLAPIESLSRDYSKEKPASDELYRVYRGLYAYERTELNAVIETVDESPPYWRREKIAFNAATLGERMGAVLFVPKNAAPPYQTVVFFPGSSAFLIKGSSDRITGAAGDFILRSGRAFLYPIYKWSYERGGGTASVPTAPSGWRDLYLAFSKDLGRSIDYLESRQDIDCARLAFYGISSGALVGPVLTAVDGRFRAAIFELGGLPLDRQMPEADPINFAPRVTIPVLMLNGRFDFSYPLENSQRPLFRWLGAPEKDKRLALFDGGHGVPRAPKIKEILDWLDRYLGPVKTKPG